MLRLLAIGPHYLVKCSFSHLVLDWYCVSVVGLTEVLFGRKSRPAVADG